MAALFKIALLAVLVTAVLAVRDTRDAERNDDMEREEIRRRQWQYNGWEPVEEEMRRQRPEDHRRRVPRQSQNRVETEDQSHSQGRDESAETTLTKTSEKHRRRHENQRRHESEESESSREVPREKEDALSKRIEPKHPVRRNLEPTKGEGKAPRTTQGPFGSYTTKLQTETAPTHPTPLLPPLSRRYRRIYNPDETADIQDHPYLAAVLVNRELWCGGAIISSDMVFTAAHCLQLQYNNRFFREYVKMLTVRVGSSNATAGGELLQVDEIFFHPNYKPQTLEFNYAVLRLHKNISLDGLNVSKIEYSKRRDVPVDRNVTFLGWGSVLGMGDKGGDVLLQKVELPVYDKADCADIYGRDLVTASNFCAGYISRTKNVCNHDAGGPAVMDDELVGLLSFSSKRCDEPDRPAVFVSAGAAAEWLQTIPEKRKKSDELQQGWMNLQNGMQ